MHAHCTEEDLVLYYYGEARRHRAIERHLEACDMCRASHEAMAGSLALVGKWETPDRDDTYGAEVWQRIRHKLPESRPAPWMDWFRGDRVLKLSAAAAIAGVAFVAGREWPRKPAGNPAQPRAVESIAAVPGPAFDGREDILIAAVAEHLDRAERVLTDIMNGPAREDISTEQQWAQELLATNRLYRQGALDVDESSLASVLDELERSLLEIVHSPSRVSAATLESLRRRIDAAALLFKVRVMGDSLRQRGYSNGIPSNTTHVS